MILAMLLSAWILYGQEKDTTYWQYSEIMGFNFNTAAFSSNWTGVEPTTSLYQLFFWGNGIMILP